jgi:hypothetical protein
MTHYPQVSVLDKLRQNLLNKSNNYLGFSLTTVGRAPTSGALPVPGEAKFPRQGGALGLVLRGDKRHQLSRVKKSGRVTAPALKGG